MMDAKVSRAYDMLWLWHELGELCKILRWPASGAAVIAIFWTGCTGTWPAGAAWCLVGLAGAMLLLHGGIALSGMMAGRTVRRIDRMLGIGQ